jgi:hypothetical protein
MGGAAMVVYLTESITYSSEERADEKSYHLQIGGHDMYLTIRDLSELKAVLDQMFGS